MTNDKCLEILAHERQCFIDECYQDDGELEAYDMAISTMRKYQKIEQIVNSNPDYIHPTDMDTYKVNSIRKVVEDGNTN